MDSGIKIPTNKVSTTNELILTWDQIKTFYNSLKNMAFLNYVEFTDYYYIWLSFRDQKMYIPSLTKNTEECLDFENNYKAISNITEWPRTRNTTCKAGRKMHNRYITFKTSGGKFSDNTSWDNTDWQDLDYGDLTYKLFDSSKVLITSSKDSEETLDGTLAKETWLEIEPTFDYEIAAGIIYIPESLSDDLDAWEVHVVGIPDVPASLGGSVHLLANPRIKWLLGKSLSIDVHLNPSELKYNSLYHTNKLRIVIKHPVGAVAEFQFGLELFK